MIARRYITALLVALVVSGVCTFWLGHKFIKCAAGPVSHVRYVATKQVMEAGDILHAGSLEMISWPEKMPLAGTFARPEQVEGRTLLYPLASGQPIVEQQLSAPGSGPGLSPKIPEGMRAISLKSDQIVGVAGFLLPGTHVDVLVTYKVDPSPDPLTSIVVQDAQVLTAGQKMQPDPEGKPTPVDVVTLLVTPSDADKVVLASTQGTVHFVLRNGSDHQHVDDQPAHLSQFGVLRQNRVPREVRTQVTPVAKPYTVQTIRGDRQTLESFQ